MACFLENDHNCVIIIPSYENKDNITYYNIHVTVGTVSWTVSHRYKDFVELHEILVTNHCFSKELLPQKKLIGNRDPGFIEKRRNSLQIYLRTILNYLQKAMPIVLLKFLDFDKYDITYILQGMALKCFREGDSCLQKSSEFAFNPLQLHAITETLHKCYYPDEVCGGQFDFSHVVEFCCKLKTVVVRGGRSKVGNSNLIYNNLPFELSMFKSATNIYFYNVQLCNINDLGSLRQTLLSIIIYNSNIQNFVDVLLCDRVHKTSENPEDKWNKLTKIDFSWNELRRLDANLALVPNLQSLILDGNQISRIENTELLPNLTYLCMSANNIIVEECLYSKLKNVVQLNLSQNKITKLSPFARLTNLKELNLCSNWISESNEIKYISRLPELEYLVLTGNPVSTIIDYRIKVFEYFGDRAKYLCLDNERPSQKELDTAAVLRALTVVREGKTPFPAPLCDRSSS